MYLPPSDGTDATTRDEEMVTMMPHDLKQMSETAAPQWSGRSLLLLLGLLVSAPVVTPATAYSNRQPKPVVNIEVRVSSAVLDHDDENCDSYVTLQAKQVHYATTLKLGTNVPEWEETFQFFDVGPNESIKFAVLNSFNGAKFGGNKIETNLITSDWAEFTYDIKMGNVIFNARQF
jgi:hypothetical protein